MNASASPISLTLISSPALTWSAHTFAMIPPIVVAILACRSGTRTRQECGAAVGRASCRGGGEPRLTCPSFGGPVAVASEQVGVEHRRPAYRGQVDRSVLANPTAPANLGDVEPVPAHEPGHVALGDPVAALARPAILANHLDFNLREHCVSSRLWLLVSA